MTGNAAHLVINHDAAGSAAARHEPYYQHLLVMDAVAGLVLTPCWWRPS